MLTTGLPRSFARISKATLPSLRTSTYRTSSSRAQLYSGCYLSSLKRPQAHLLPRHIGQAKPLLRHQTTTQIDLKHEQDVGKQKVESSPDTVSTQSSTRPVLSELGQRGGHTRGDVDMFAGLKADVKIVLETFSLRDVPRDAYYIGLAGVLPYLATSLSTAYCAFEINHNADTGVGYLMSGHNAELLLHILEPLQIGYGAVIVSCLGTIHWGLEWAGYGGHHGYKRYMIGVLAPAVAWPTVLLPIEYALITQFLAFNFLYYTDAQATVEGWTPPWYGTYRFVLTFIVGASIVISLIGRGQIQDQIGKLPGPADRIKAFRDAQREDLAQDEAARKGFVAEDE